MNIFDEITKKLNIKVNKFSNSVSNPIGQSDYDAKNEFFNIMSKRAINLYERQCDIKNFTKLALSNPENTSHNERVEALLKEDVLDPLSEEVIKQLSDNQDLIRDLNL